MVMEAKNVKLDCKCDTTNESGSIHETVFPSASRIDNLGSSLQTCVPETSYHSVTGQKHVRSSIERQNSCASKSSFSRSRSPSSEGSEACLRSRSRHYKDGKSRRKISPQRVCKRRSESPLRRRRKVSSSGSSSHTSREFRHRSRSPLRQEYRRGRSSRSRSPPRRNQRHRPSESSSSSPLHRRNGSESPLRHKRNRNDRLLSREGYRSYEGRSPSAHHLDTRRNRSRFELSSRDSVRVSSMQQKFVERRPGSPHRRPSQNIRNSSGQSRAVSTRYTRGRSNPPQFEQSMPRELKILLNDARYFLIRSSNFDNLLLAKSESVWSTPPHNETRLNDAFRVWSICFYTWLWMSLF